MKNLMTAIALSCALFAPASHAADAASAPMGKPAAAAASAPMGKQQTKMGECNKDAGDKKGDERKAFMKTCLSAKKATQQDKMKACNADPKAKSTKGDERKAFMKECLSK